MIDTPAKDSASAPFPENILAAAVQPGDGASVHMPFLDGLRGLAALYVVFFHLRVPHLPHQYGRFLAWSNYGHAAVGIFIVLSGYCLMLPVARSAEGDLRGGWRHYLERRARRILPPYYAALALAVLLDYFHERNHGGRIDPGAVASHLLLVHNLSERWYQALDIPMWSVATEWQIYFALPLLLLPVWRRFGIAAATAAALIAGVLPHLLLPRQYNLDCACPWFLGLFGLGMLGAAITDHAPTRSKTRGSASVWLLASGAALAAICASYGLLAELRQPGSIAFDFLVGVCAACFIVACARVPREPAAQPAWARALLPLLQSRIALVLGACSYSLYLTHSLIYFLVTWILARRVHSLPKLQAAEYLVALPLILVFAGGFYFVFERPTMKSARDAASRLPKSAPA